MGEDGRAMTDLIRRPTSGSGRPAEPVARPLGVAAPAAGAVAALVSLVICLACALTAWFLADAGAHGDTTDALRVGSVTWLIGHGSRAQVGGMPIGMVPLAVTMMLVLVAFRSGRAAARNAAPVTDDRTLFGAIGTFACGYVVVAVLVGVLGAEATASVSLPRTVLGALAISGLAGGIGLAAGSGRLDLWMDRVPGWARQVVVGAVAGALALIAASAVLVAGALLGSFSEAATILSGLDLSVGDAVSLTFVTALFAPNVVLLGASYLLGPGFAFGVGTTVSPTAVSLGVVPALPVLAALPGEGSSSGWLNLLIAVPALAAAIGVGLARRGTEPPAYDLAALQGAGAGFAAGVLVTVAIAMAGGPLGTGRLVEIGAPVAEVLVFAVGTMSVGGVIGGLVTTWLQRRR